MRPPCWKLSVAASVLVASLNPAVSSAQIETLTRSATIARDVNGFHLGMPLTEAQRLAKLEFIGGDQFEATVEDVRYNFGVTSEGRIYRVQSSQSLGQFRVDRSFLETLKHKLSSKYGPPISQSGEVFHWELIENVTTADGKTVPFRTMWMTALVGGFESNRTLDITIIDFRILWADEARANRAPRTTAEDSLKF